VLLCLRTPAEDPKTPKYHNFVAKGYIITGGAGHGAHRAAKTARRWHNEGWVKSPGVRAGSSRFSGLIVNPR